MGTAKPSAPLRSFQDAMEALQHHRFEAAAEAFRALLAAYPAERALAERARVYLALCDRELEGRTGFPATPEECLTAATAALNDDRDVEAERLIRAVLGHLPNHDLALYLMAAVHARRGEAEAAVEWLDRAIRVSPDVRAQAIHDSDFEGLRDRPDFRTVVEPHASAQSGVSAEGKGSSER